MQTSLQASKQKNISPVHYPPNPGQFSFQLLLLDCPLSAVDAQVHRRTSQESVSFILFHKIPNWISSNFCKSVRCKTRWATTSSTTWLGQRGSSLVPPGSLGHHSPQPFIMLLIRIMATHHTGFLELMDRIIVLEEGKCVLEGRWNPSSIQGEIYRQNKCWNFSKHFLKIVLLWKYLSFQFRYLDIKDSPEFQRYTSTTQTQKEADGGMEEVDKEIKEMESKEEEEVEEEKRQHGRVRIDWNQIPK